MPAARGSAAVGVGPQPGDAVVVDDEDVDEAEPLGAVGCDESALGGHAVAGRHFVNRLEDVFGVGLRAARPRQSPRGQAPRLVSGLPL